MNLKTALIGTAITTSTLLGGCARKNYPNAEKIFRQTQKELIAKQESGKLFTKEDSILFNAVRNVEKANAKIDESKAAQKFELANLVYKKDSIKFSKKNHKTQKDSLYMQSLEMTKNISEFFKHVERAISDYKKRNY